MKQVIEQGWREFPSFAAAGSKVHKVRVDAAAERLITAEAGGTIQRERSLAAALGLAPIAVQLLNSESQINKVEKVKQVTEIRIYGYLLLHSLGGFSYG